MSSLLIARTQSPVGPLVLGVSERGLAHLEFERSYVPSSISGKECRDADEELQPYIAEVEEYFAGTRREFSFALDLHGTDFQLKCWRALLTIPYGEVRTYGDLARQVGCPKGFRAVGMANHDNPIAIVVPCHRVIATGGALGGYAVGLEAKRWLLEHEGVTLSALSPKLPFAAHSR